MELLLDRGLAHVDVEEFEVEGRVRVDGHLLVRLDDLLDLDIDEVVERIEVLLDQAAHLQAGGRAEARMWCVRARLQQGRAPHLQEGRQQAPLLLDLFDRRLRRRFAVQQARLCTGEWKG